MSAAFAVPPPPPASAFQPLVLDVATIAGSVLPSGVAVPSEGQVSPRSRGAITLKRALSSTPSTSTNPNADATAKPAAASTLKHTRTRLRTSVPTLSLTESLLNARVESSSDDEGETDFMDSGGVGLSPGARTRSLKARAPPPLRIQLASVAAAAHGSASRSPLISPKSSISIKTPNPTGSATASPQAGVFKPTPPHSSTLHSTPSTSSLVVSVLASGSGSQVHVTPEDRTFWMYSHLAGGAVKVGLAKEQSSPGPGAYDALSSFPVDFASKQLYLDRRNHQKRFASKHQQSEKTKRLARSKSLKGRSSLENNEPNGLQSMGFFTPQPTTRRLELSGAAALERASSSYSQVPSAIATPNPSANPSGLASPRSTLSRSVITSAAPATAPALVRQQSSGAPRKDKEPIGVNTAPSTPAAAAAAAAFHDPHGLSAKEKRVREMQLKDSVVRIMSERVQTKIASNAGAVAAPRILRVGEDEPDDDEEAEVVAPAPAPKPVLPPPRTPIKSLTELAVHTQKEMARVNDLDTLSLVEAAHAQIHQARVQLKSAQLHSAHSSSGGFLVMSSALAQFARPTGPSPFERAILERWSDAPAPRAKRRNPRAINVEENENGGGDEEVKGPEILSRGVSELSQANGGAAGEQHEEQKQSSSSDSRPYAYPHSKHLPLRHALPSLLIEPFQPLIDGAATVSAPSSSNRAGASFSAMIQAQEIETEQNLQVHASGKRKKKRGVAAQNKHQHLTIRANGTGQTDPSPITESLSLRALDQPPASLDAASDGGVLSPALQEFSRMFEKLLEKQQRNEEYQRTHSNALLTHSLASELATNKSRLYGIHGKEDLLHALTHRPLMDDKVRVHASNQRSVMEHIPTKHRMEYSKLDQAMKHQERILELRAQIVRNNEGYSGKPLQHEFFRHQNQSVKRIQPDLLKFDVERAGNVKEKLDFSDDSDLFTSPKKRPMSTGSSTARAFPSSEAHHLTISAAQSFDPSIVPTEDLVSLLSGGGGVHLPDRIKRNLWSDYAKSLPERVEGLQRYYFDQAQGAEHKKKHTTQLKVDGYGK